MSIRFVTTPDYVQRVFPHRIWHLPNDDKAVYLTFDDGPVPEITPWVIELLNQHQAKATFFCIGANIEKHPGIFNMIKENGHRVGNHTFNHLKSWESTSEDYLADIRKLNTALGVKTNLFRPPYGRIKPRHAKLVRDLGYKLVMWDVLSYDFDQTLSIEDCLSNVIDNIRPGSIVVMHDSVKAETNLRYCLPKILKYINEKGWSCSSIPE